MKEEELIGGQFYHIYKPTRLKRESVLGWFDNEANFKNLHNEKIDIEKIEKWLEL